MKCKVCNKEFGLTKNRHYVSRGEEKTGLAAIGGGSEVELFDTFDCPFCGCQNVVQERKRPFTIKPMANEEKSLESQSGDSYGDVCFGQYDVKNRYCYLCEDKDLCESFTNSGKTEKDHDGCDGCKHMDKGTKEIPCCICKGTAMVNSDEHKKRPDYYERNLEEAEC